MTLIGRTIQTIIKQACHFRMRGVRPDLQDEIPSFAGGGLALPTSLSAFFMSPNRSTLVSLLKWVLSLTGLALCEPPAVPGLMLLLPLPPWLAMPTPGEERCGMFSGRGC